MDAGDTLDPAILTRELESFVALASSSDAPVLLTGETGAGKTFLARLIHKRSRRSRQPIQELACGAVSESLLEAELFGHTGGAFTGAQGHRQGVVGAAAGGTLVLNEVEAIPVGRQAVLLDLVETGVVRAVGGEKGTPVDVRIIATTNADVGKAILTGRLRKDLVLRLRKLPFRVPPLRDRRDQLPGFAELILKKEWMTIGGQNGAACPALTESALEALGEYDWPGNVRELAAVLFQAALETSMAGRKSISGVVVRSVLKEHGGLFQGEDGGAPVATDTQAGKARYMAPTDPEEERKLIFEALEAEAGNQTRAARRLGMSRTTLWERMRRHGVRH